MASMEMQLGHSLQARLSPRLQRAVKLLQMSSLDFALVVREALDTNPFLEVDPDAESASTESPGDEPEATQDDRSGLDEPGWGAEPMGRSRLVDGDSGVFDNLMAQTSLAEHLVAQLKLLPLSPRDAAMAAAIAESLDDDGYLRTPLEEIGAALPLRPPADPQELRIALHHVQALEPAGVGARSVAECLQLQLEAIACPDRRALAGEILRSQLPALASRDVNGIARRLGAASAEVELACAAIRRLDPRPGWQHGLSNVQYLVPDVIARKIRGQWTAVLNPVVVPPVRLNRSYADLFARHRDDQHGELGGQLQEAKWTVRNVEQRFGTILSVAQAILRRQQHFLAYGAMAMKPLSLREIADEVGVHESTVSRVTNNKFMGTPAGVYELKFFFSRGLSTAAGGECSPTAIRSLIQEMIGGESRHQPLSDVDIARQLSAQGLQVARRTVTKYRQLMKIGAAAQRQAPRGGPATPVAAAPFRA